VWEIHLWEREGWWWLGSSLGIGCLSLLYYTQPIKWVERERLLCAVFKLIGRLCACECVCVWACVCVSVCVSVCARACVWTRALFSSFKLFYFVGQFLHLIEFFWSTKDLTHIQKLSVCVTKCVTYFLCVVFVRSCAIGWFSCVCKSSRDWFSFNVNRLLVDKGASYL